MGTTTFAATKLTIPTSVRPVVARPDLVEQLDQTWYRMGLVSAPAGFGKTSLLAMWAAGRRDSVAWLSCDVTDGEPTRFWLGLLAAVGARWPGVGDDAAVLLERSGCESHELAISLANDLSAVGGPMVIVLDDFHLAAPTPAVFAGLVGALPATVRLIIGSRVDPPLPLGRLRVAGALLELHNDDLYFSPAETAAVLVGNDVALDREQTERLHELTEGWPAGVQLGALALRRATDRSGFLDAFASTDRVVADFLVGEVLDRQPAELVEFLYATAVLEEFDAALCEAVAGPEHAARLLATLVAANLFVVRMDVGGGWYRYHHLFGAFLRARLRGLGQPRWRAAHERAAEALEERGDIVGALRHATASGDLQRAAAISRRTLKRWITVVDPDATVVAARHWLHRYGRELVATDPVQVLDYLLLLVATTNADDAVWWLDQIAASHPDASPTLTAMLHGIRAEHHLCRGEADDAIGRARMAMDAVGGTPPNESQLPTLPVVLSRAHLQADDRASARAVLDAAEAHRTGHPVIDRVRVPALQAWVAYLDGELRRAEHRRSLAIACAGELELPSSEIGRIFAGLTLAGLHIERGEDGAARQLLDELRHNVDLGRRPSVQSLVVLQQARYARIVGDEATAEAELSLARRLLPNACHAVRSTFAIEAVRQAMQFRPSTAADLIDALDDGPSTTLLRIRLALSEGDQRGAAAFLDRLPAATTPRERVVRAVLTARTLIDRDVDAANAELSGALAEAHQEGFRRTILGQGPDMLKLLMSFTPTTALEGYVGELIDAAATVAAPLRPLPVTPLVDPLTERELTVLRYLCSRLTYQEIASALYVSRNTLKSHVGSVYRKLAVGSRSEAVDAGRRLRIV